LATCVFAIYHKYILHEMFTMVHLASILAVLSGVFVSPRPGGGRSKDKQNSMIRMIDT